MHALGFSGVFMQYMRLIMGKWCLHVSLFIFDQSSSKVPVTRTGIKAPTSSISGLWFPWPIFMFFEMRFDLGTLDLGERSLPFGLLGFSLREIEVIWIFVRWLDV